MQLFNKIVGTAVQNLASHEQPIANPIHHNTQISNTQINRETQNLASLLFSTNNSNQHSSPYHNNAPALLSVFFLQHALWWRKSDIPHTVNSLRTAYILTSYISLLYTRISAHMHNILDISTMHKKASERGNPASRKRLSRHAGKPV